MPPPEPVAKEPPIQPRHVAVGVLLLALIALFVWRPFAGAGARRECTADDLVGAHEALAQADKMLRAPPREGVWPSLFHALEDYRHCDEEPIAAAFSSASCAFLSTRWSELGEVGRAARKHSWLRAFLVTHLDATCDEGQLRAIVALSAKKCPRYAKGLCAALATKARAALEEYAEDLAATP